MVREQYILYPQKEKTIDFLKLMKNSHQYPKEIRQVPIKETITKKTPMILEAFQMKKKNSNYQALENFRKYNKITKWFDEYKMDLLDRAREYQSGFALRSQEIELIKLRCQKGNDQKKSSQFN